MARYPARYYDGRTARARDVWIEVAPAGIGIRSADGAHVASWAADRVVLVERPGGGEPVRLGLDGTAARLIVEDRAVLEALGPIASNVSKRARMSGRDIARVAAWAGAAVASAAVVIVVLVPLFSAQLASATPGSLKLRLGLVTLDRLATIVAALDRGSKGGRYCGGAGGLKVLNLMADRIVAGMSDAPALRLVVLNTDMVNAFALPGNIVAVTGGLIENAESAEEVAGIVAHEIGHVVHDHPTRALYRTAAVSTLVGVAIGDLTGGVLLGGLAEWVLNASYSREAERDADGFALTRLNAAGIDARGLAAFFARLLEKGQADGPLPRILSTHPPTGERMAAIRSGARATGKALPAERDWTDLRRVCRDTGNVPPALADGGVR